MQLLSTLTVMAILCSVASAASTYSGYERTELLQVRAPLDDDLARACAINPSRCDPNRNVIPPQPRAPPPDKTTNTTNNNETNKASVSGNSGVIGASGNVVKEKDECNIMIGSRSLQKRGEHRENDHGKRGAPAGKAPAAPAGKPQGGGNKPAAGGNKAQGGGGTKSQGGAGGGGGKPPAAGQADGEKKKPFKDPNTLKWKPAQTTTDKQGEVFYHSKCYCNCVRKRSEIQIGDIHARTVAAVLEPTCSIVGTDAEKQWKGKCDKSTIEGRPITEVFSKAP